MGPPEIWARGAYVRDVSPASYLRDVIWHWFTCEAKRRVLSDSLACWKRGEMLANMSALPSPESDEESRCVSLELRNGTCPCFGRNQKRARETRHQRCI